MAVVPRPSGKIRDPMPPRPSGKIKDPIPDRKPQPNIMAIPGFEFGPLITTLGDVPGGLSNILSNSDKGGGGDPTDHAAGRRQQGQQDPGKQVGDPNRVIREGTAYRDSDSGYTVYVKGNRVVIVDPQTGQQVTQFTNPRANAQDRINSGKWNPI
jgi:hypothetical protein